MYEGRQSEAIKLISTYDPKEVLYSKKDKAIIERELQDSFYTYGLEEWIWQLDYTRGKILDLFKVTNLKGYGIENAELGQIAAGTILHYLESTQQKNLQHINKIGRIQLTNYVWLDHNRNHNF